MPNAEYREKKAYFDACEKEMKKNPLFCNHQIAFLKYGKKLHGKSNLLFPIVIKSGRLSFGKLHLLITPLAESKGILGETWVERKMLVMEHDFEYQIYRRALPVEE